MSSVQQRLSADPDLQVAARTRLPVTNGDRRATTIVDDDDDDGSGGGLISRNDHATLSHPVHYISALWPPPFTQSRNHSNSFTLSPAGRFFENV